jgi:hypothetical protein
MESLKRFLVRAGWGLLVVVLLAGAWKLQGWRCQRELTEQARLEGQRVFRAFLAGSAPTVIAGRVDSFELSALTFLTTSRVAFLHLLAADGRVIYSSDVRLRGQASAGERAAWALKASELHTREGTSASLLEIAAPISAPEGPLAYLWLGYRLDEGG